MKLTETQEDLTLKRFSQYRFTVDFWQKVQETKYPDFKRTVYNDRRPKDIFPEGGTRGFFPKNFLDVPKVVKFVFSHSKLGKQPFLLQFSRCRPSSFLPSSDDHVYDAFLYSTRHTPLCIYLCYKVLQWKHRATLRNATLGMFISQSFIVMLSG